MNRVGLWIAIAVILVLFIVLGGCATPPPKPEVVARIEQLPPIETPIPVRCIDPADVPEEPPTAMRPDDGLWDNLPQMRIDLNAYKIYVLKAAPLMKKCTIDPKANPTTEVKK